MESRWVYWQNVTWRYGRPCTGEYCQHVTWAFTTDMLYVYSYLSIFPTGSWVNRSGRLHGYTPTTLHRYTQPGALHVYMETMCCKGMRPPSYIGIQSTGYMGIYGQHITLNGGILSTRYVTCYQKHYGRQPTLDEILGGSRMISVAIRDPV